MTWNYRIIRNVVTFGDKKYPRYSVHEVFYNDDGSIMTCTQDPEELCWTDDTDIEALENLKECIKTIARDIEKHPVLDITNIPGCEGEE